ncbi:MAG: aminoacetone oxidase family FAD-binding enzyme [Lachnospiraceae bacterium]|nr:aminoacetone oxidase family FAD-binding enzyme [Lachnospiraceae bacterium]
MKTLIIGAGPAGLMSGIISARCGDEVTIIDSNKKAGKKIYATGNGRCNFTNMNMKNGDLYRGNPEFAAKVIRRFNNKNLITFFNELGIIERNIDGYIYPSSEQAASVAEKLTGEFTRLKGSLVLGQKAVDIRMTRDKKFSVFTETDFYTADKLIIATGGLAAPVHGSDGSLNRILTKLGHSFVKQVPALVNLLYKDRKLDNLAGVRTRAGVVLKIIGNAAANEAGEIVFTKGNISGIPVMQLSRYASYAFAEKKNVELVIDLFKDLTSEELDERLRSAIYGPYSSGKSIYEVLSGTVNSKLLDYALRSAGIDPDKKAYTLKPQKFNDMISAFKGLEIKIKDVGGFDKAQVTAGGIKTSELDDNLQSKLVKNLYFAGEIIDVDGTCGGYNLQWAFSSGYIAGKSGKR